MNFWIKLPKVGSLFFNAVKYVCRAVILNIVDSVEMTDLADRLGKASITSALCLGWYKCWGAWEPAENKTNTRYSWSSGGRGEKRGSGRPPMSKIRPTGKLSSVGTISNAALWDSLWHGQEHIWSSTNSDTIVNMTEFLDKHHTVLIWKMPAQTRSQAVHNYPYYYLPKITSFWRQI